MKHYITLEESELSSVITKLGHNLHSIAESIIYFQHYARLQGTKHDAVVDMAIKEINKSLGTLKYEFNLPKQNNPCLVDITKSKIEEIIKKADKDHGNSRTS